MADPINESADDLAHSAASDHISVNTEALVQASKYLSTAAANLRNSTEKTVPGLAIPADRFPLAVPKVAENYGYMHSGLTRLLPALQAVILDLSSGLSAVGQSYEANEQTSAEGFNFTYGTSGTHK